MYPSFQVITFFASKYVLNLYYKEILICCFFVVQINPVWHSFVLARIKISKTNGICLFRRFLEELYSCYTKFKNAKNSTIDKTKDEEVYHFCFQVNSTISSCCGIYLLVKEAGQFFCKNSRFKLLPYSHFTFFSISHSKLRNKKIIFSYEVTSIRRQKTRSTSCSRNKYLKAFHMALSCQWKFS